eukprot:scaffold7679_cov403-Prasinococcus_capsulatus_cf.AAC.2
MTCKDQDDACPTQGGSTDEPISYAEGLKGCPQAGTLGPQRGPVRRGAIQARVKRSCSATAVGAIGGADRCGVCYLLKGISHRYAVSRTMAQATRNKCDRQGWYLHRLRYKTGKGPAHRPSGLRAEGWMAHG